MHTSDPSVNTRYKVIVVMMTMILITSTLLLSGIFFIKPVNAQGGMGDDSASGELTTEMRNWEMRILALVSQTRKYHKVINLGNDIICFASTYKKKYPAVRN